MTIKIPPPPANAEQNTRMWKDWFLKLQATLSSTAGVAWALVDKTGSALADLAIRPHSALTTVHGTGDYHLTVNAVTMQSQTTDPSTTDIPAGQWAIYKNTVAVGTPVKLWVNDGGVMKSVTLT